MTQVEVAASSGSARVQYPGWKTAGNMSCPLFTTT
jgi:hypothetical protein